MSRHALRKYAVLGALAWAAEGLFLRQYRRIIAVSPGTRSAVRRSAARGARISVVPNGVDPSCFVPDPTEGDFVLYFGRLDIYNKGIDLLIEAFARIQKAWPAVRLIIAGRGTTQRVSQIEARVIRSGLGGRVDVLGSVSDAERERLYQSALFACVPSRYEGWGITALEAGAATKAVVGANIPGLRDAIRDGRTGLLVASENVEALAGAIGRLLDEPRTRERLGRAGRCWAQRFSWDGIAAAQESIYTGAPQQATGWAQ